MYDATLAGFGIINTQHMPMSEILPWMLESSATDSKTNLRAAAGSDGAFGHGELGVFSLVYFLVLQNSCDQYISHSAMQKMLWTLQLHAPVVVVTHVEAHSARLLSCGATLLIRLGTDTCSTWFHLTEHESTAELKVCWLYVGG